MVTSSGLSVDGSLASQVSRVKQRWWLVVAVTAVCATVALWSSVGDAPIHTARASLVMSSDNRSPDQDAVLVQGFAAYLNSPAYQAKLIADGVLPSGTSLEATTSAGSPILLVDVTSTSRGTAQSAAARVATVFTRDMNRGAEEREAALERLLEQLSAEVAQGGAGPSDTSQEALTALSEQLGELRSPRSNLLDVLQLKAGVTSTQSSPVRSLGLGIVGGGVLGVLLALLVGRLSNRVTSRADLEALGLTSLSDAVVDPGAPTFRSEMRAVATVLGARTGLPGSLAVAATSENDTADVVAHAVSTEWARSGRTVLAVLPEPPVDAQDGSADDEPAAPHALHKLGGRLTRGAVDDLWLLTPELEQADQAHLVDITVRSLELLRADGPIPVDAVVVAVRGLGRLPDAAALCVVAAQAIVVGETSTTRLDPTARVIRHLGENGVRLLGGVLVGGAGRTGRAKHKVSVRRA